MKSIKNGLFGNVLNSLHTTDISIDVIQLRSFVSGLCIQALEFHIKITLHYKYSVKPHPVTLIYRETGKTNRDENVDVYFD